MKRTFITLAGMLLIKAATAQTPGTKIDKFTGDTIITSNIDTLNYQLLKPNKGKTPKNTLVHLNVYTTKFKSHTHNTDVFLNLVYMTLRGRQYLNSTSYAYLKLSDGSVMQVAYNGKEHIFQLADNVLFTGKLTQEDVDKLKSAKVTAVRINGVERFEDFDTAADKQDVIAKLL